MQPLAELDDDLDREQGVAAPLEEVVVQTDMVDPEDDYPIVTTITLQDGELEGGCFGSAGGTYDIDGDAIAFYSNEYGHTLEVTFTADADGNLTLLPGPNMDPGDAFQCFSQVWTKIE